MPQNRSKYLLPVLITALFVILFIRYYDRGPTRHFSDFRVYHATAERFLAGENIYDTSNPLVTPFKYSPVFALLISPLGLLPIHSASLVFFTVNFFLFLFFIIYSEKLISLFVPARPALGFWESAVFYGVPLAAVGRFALLVMDSGQANLLMVALALGGLYLIEKKKEWRGAALLALSVMMKYVTFIFVPYLILRKKWKAAAGTILGIVAYSFLPALVCGWERATRYLLDWMPFITKTSLDTGSWTDYKNQSVYSWVLRLVMKNSPYAEIQPSLSLFDFHGALLAGVGAAMLLYFLLLASSFRKGSNPAAIYGALFAGLAIFNPNCWPFNFVVLYLPLTFLVYAFIRDRRRWRVAGVCAVVLVLLNFGTQAWASDQMQEASEMWSFMAIAGVTVFVALIFYKPEVLDEKKL